jgi:hypothetical protein
MSGIKRAMIIGSFPIIVGIIYFVFQQALGSQATIDPAGVTLLISLGLAMGFGMLVILVGARDL